MATQTETFKLNKPARTDNVGIELLNENMDIIEEELKKRPIGSEIPDAAFFELDITEWTSVDPSNEEGEAFYITDYVDGAELLAQIESGRIPRVVFSLTGGRAETVILGAKHQYTTDDGDRTTCSGMTSNTYYDAYSNYSLNIVVASDGTYTIWFAAYPFLTGEGTVKSVNGVTPDEDGNVVVTVTEPATTTLDFTNWDLEEGAYYRETLDDGSSITHAILRDTDGNITSLGGITIEGVE